MGVICLDCPARISRQLGQMERPAPKFLIHGGCDADDKDIWVCGINTNGKNLK